MIRLISLDQTFGMEPKQTNILAENSPVNVIDYGDGIFCIKVVDDLNQNSLSEPVILGLEKSFATVREQKNAKAILLTGGEEWFLSSKTTEKEMFFARKTLFLPLECDVPVIAVMKGESTGLGWLMGALCDFMICCKESSYQYFSQDLNWQPCEEELFLFEERFGKEFASELLLSSKNYTGIDLREKGLGMPILSKDEIDSYALAFARRLTEAPIKSVVLLKKHLSQGMTRRAQRLLSSFTPIPKDKRNIIFKVKNDVFEDQSTIQGAILDLGSPKNIKMNSNVVLFQVYHNGVVLVTLCDKENKNTFSDSFVQGVKEVFEEIEKSSEYKVVILTGYDQYFACGGTKEGLIAIQKGETKFTDVMIYSLALECKIPVIASMQGHGIGAGWSIGMFCDHVLFSKESVYLSPYMRYGFTPGAGSTLVFPEKFGMDLGREILFTANEYKGDELRARGMKMPVLSRVDIQDYALKLGSIMALSSREELISLKTSRCNDLRHRVSAIYGQELAMHEESFVNNEEVFQRIQNNFNEKIQTTKQIASLQVKTPEISDLETDEIISKQIQERLRITLAEELHMAIDMIDDELAFIEMGLDSIIGVTWVRKINTEYSLSIAATSVYSYPTIVQFAKYVMNEGKKNGLFQRSNKIQTTKQIASLQVKPPDSLDLETDEDISQRIQERLRVTLAEELHMTKNMIDDELAFIEMGLDSIIGVTWVRKINAEFGLSLAATQVYSHPTIAQFTKYVMSEGKKQGLFHVSLKESTISKSSQVKVFEPARKEVLKTYPTLTSLNPEKFIDKTQILAVKSREKEPKNQTQAIAVIGMSGEFPKSKTLDEFWNNLIYGKDCISEIPRARWDVSEYYDPNPQAPGKTHCKWMGVLEDAAQFDPLFFNISPSEAELMDPQQRVFLQSVWHCIEDSAYSPSQLSGTRCGVFVGCGVGDYVRLLNEELSAKGFTGGSTSILAARISYLLNLQGPCISIDTACSSSLVAIASACDSLILGNSDLALAGGVCVLAGPSVHIMASKAGMLSEEGRCYSFDQRANGFVPGEGVGVVFLKRLEDAERDRDQIHAVIRGWGVNQDGKTNGITAPNPNSQARLEKEIYEKFGINPESIQLVETHGTGTKLGDPIEVEGLQKSFKSYTTKEHYCALGSVKSNVGHLLTAAGIAGMIKLILSLKYQKIPPTIHYEKLNEHIDLEKSPFYINTEFKDWPISGGQKRRCAISSFGFSGTNAHIVIEEYIAVESQTLQKPFVVNSAHPAIVVLSAKNQTRLIEYAKSLLKFIQKNPNTNLANLAYTFQVGREAMDERLGLIVPSMQMLEEKLQAFIEGKGEVDNLYRGHAKQNKEALKVFTTDEDRAKTIDMWIAKGKYGQLLEFWVKGLNVDWKRLYQDRQPQRISAPIYPFAKERYWADTNEFSTISAETLLTTKNLLYPLIHENTSKLGEQRFCSTLTGAEFFLRDHQVQGQKVLPGVVYLEMAQAALSQSLDSFSKNNEHIALKNIVWARPLTVNGPTKITIRLFPAENGESGYEIYTDSKVDEGSPVIYSQGVALVCSFSDVSRLNLADLQIKLNKSQIDRQECYEAFVRMGLNYGPAHQGIERIYVGEKAVLAKLSLPIVLEKTKKLFRLHPSLLDAALQASIGLSFSEEKRQLSLPFALERLDILNACTESMWAWVRYSEGWMASDKMQKLDIDLCNDDGLVCIKMRGFSVRVFDATLLDNPIWKASLIDSEGDLPIYPDKVSMKNTNALEDVQESTRGSVFDVSKEELDEKALKEKTITYFKKQLSKVLKLPVQKIETEEPFEKYGIDSIVVMQLTNELEKTFGSMSKTLFFEYQTIQEISEYFLMSYRSSLIKILDFNNTKQIVDQSDASLQRLSTPKKVPPPLFHRSRGGKDSVLHEVTPIDIAIIGLSGKYPQSENLEEYWSNLREGRDCIIEVPKERWDWKDYYTEDRSEPGRHYSKWGGFIEDVDKFDPLFFNISPRDAQFIDPQERLFLEHVWMALEDAGYTRSDLQEKTAENLGGQVGVYAGVMYGHYQLFGAEENLRGNPVSLGNSYASIANRVSYFLNLHGPSMAIDTMCSSSLTTLHLACQDLKLGRTNLGIVGGVNLSIHPNKYLDLSMGQFISSKGRCESFGEGGEGYIPGEGVGVALLKRLSEAERDGDHIYGIIKGSILNHGGKTNGYTVPNPNAQHEVIARALKESQIHPEMISYIETHGTGTKLGDPIEITGLTKAFAFNEMKPRCWIGSAKSNIGHCESAAGIAGVTKVLLQMKNKQIVPSLHSKVLNPNIDFSNTPFIVNQELRDWERPIIDGKEYPRIAGISSFGAGGSNAHVVIEEYIPDENQTLQEPFAVNSSHPAIIVLSAKNQARLTEYAKSLLKFIQNNPKTNLANLAYTFQVGREGMDERLGLIVSSMQMLEENLQAFIEGKEEVDNLYRGNAKQNKETLAVFTSDEEMLNIIDTWFAKSKSSKLLELWVKGLNLNWNRLYQSNRPQRISAPTYPFAKERYWVDAKESSRINLEATSASKMHLHPLLHENISTLSAQRFCSTLTGTEFFLRDHQVQGQKVLPGVAYLEMVQAALSQSLDGLSKSKAHIALMNVVWVRPLTVNGPTKITIGLFPAENGEIGYEIYTDNAEDGNPVTHSQGVALLSSSDTLKLNLADLQIKLNRSQIDRQACYETFASMGLNYGPTHQGIERIYVGEKEVLAKISLPLVLEKTKNEFCLHPTLLDAALQASIGLSFNEEKRQLSLPLALERLDILNACTESMWAWVRYAAGGVASDKVQKLDIDLCDEDGLVCIKMRGFSSRVIVDTSLDISPSIATLMFKPIWKASLMDSEEALPIEITHRVFLCGLKQSSEELRFESVGMSFITLQSNQTLLEKRFVDYSLALFEHIQTLLAEKPKGPVLLQVVVPDQGPERMFSGLSGLLKSAHLENPKILGQVIMVDVESIGKELIDKLQESSKYLKDQQIHYKQDKRFVMSFAEELSFRSNAKVKREIPWRDEGIYLITGGAGGLGLLFVQEIAEQIKHATVVITGRSKLTTEKQERLDELKSLGIRLEYKEVDVCDKASIENLIQEIEREIGQLNGIIHSAGIIKDNFILKKSKEEFAQVLLPKVEGVVNLDQATQNLKHLDFFILFSSGAGAMGNVGQADYATANAFLDAFAQERQSLCDVNKRSGQTLSINWPLWKSGGMSVNQATEQMMRESIGMVPMETTSGIAAFYLALSLKQPQMVVVEGYLTQLREKFLMPAKRVHEDLKLFKDQLNSKSDADGLIVKIQSVLLQTVSELLKIKFTNIDIDTELSEYGFDSISLTEFSNKLNQKYKLGLAPTIFFEYSTIESLASHLSKEYQVLLAQQFSTVTQTEPVSSPKIELNKVPRKEFKLEEPMHLSRFSKSLLSFETKSEIPEPIAIVGMSGQFPMARDIDEFWCNLVNEKNCISEIPKERWDWEKLFGDPNTEINKTNIKWGGFIDGIAEFDPLFFNISPREAELMDPQQRLLMTYAWLALEDSAHSASSLSGANTGIFVGTTSSGYNNLIANEKIDIEGYSSTGTVASMGPNRMSYFLNIHGPSEPIETACSSSLVAIHRAILAIEAGDCDQAIVGGINTIITPEAHISFNKAGMLCQDGRCKTFSKQANGYVRSEGVGMLILKKLKAAEADGDHIYGLIRGSAQNHGGRANSLTAPNPKAQSELIVNAYKKAGIDPRTVGYIEVHGTGTELGDPIEINGLKTAFKKLSFEAGDSQIAKAYCGLGSVKTNIGHSEIAAGVSGVIKVLLQLKHKKLVKSLHCNEINPYIDLADSPFYLVKESQEWEALRDSSGKTLPRRAGVSSFGFGGSNAHIVIEEYISNEVQKSKERIPVDSANPVIIVLSAKNPLRLHEYAENLLKFLQRRSEINLAELAYTLQVGREEMEERLGFIIHSKQELEEKLQNFIEKKGGVNNLYRGQVKPNKDTLAIFIEDDDMAKTIDAWISKGKYHELLALWVKGLNFDWNKLYKNNKPQRISAPTYPFSRDHYWIKSNESQRNENHLESALQKNDRNCPSADWLVKPLQAKSVLWTEKIEAKKDHDILVISKEIDDYDRIKNICRSIAELSHNSDTLGNIAHLAIHDEMTIQELDLKPYIMNADSPLAIFLFLPRINNSNFAKKGLELAHACVQSIMDLPPRKQIQFFCCYLEQQSDASLYQEELGGIFKSALLENSRHRYRSISYDAKLLSDEEVALRVIQEWLCDEMVTKNASIVRYAQGERFELQSNGVDDQKLDQHKKNYVLEKRWDLLNIDSKKGIKFPGDVVILVNEDSLTLANSLIRIGAIPEEAIIILNTNAKDKQPISHIIDFQNYPSCKDQIQEILHPVKNIYCIIDLSDLYSIAKNKDDDPYGKIFFYQEIIASSFSELNILYFTKGLQAFQSKEMSLAGAKFAGLIKMLGVEYKNVKSISIDIDESYYTGEGVASIIFNELQATHRETEICYRILDRFVPYVHKIEVDRNQKDRQLLKSLNIFQEGVYVLSGGTGGIGLKIANYLIERGARYLVLMGRTLLPPKSEWKTIGDNSEYSVSKKNKIAAIIALEKKASLVEIYSGDLQDYGAMSRYFEKIRMTLGEIRGVIHCATSSPKDGEDAVFIKKDLKEFRSIYEAKVNGMEHLQMVFNDDPLDFFISFSSTAGQIPYFMRGLSSYGMANSYLDYFTNYQVFKGKSFFRSIAWVGWTDVGMNTYNKSLDATQRYASKLGLLFNNSKEGIELFESAMMISCQNHNLLPCLLDETCFNASRPLFYTAVNSDELLTVADNETICFKIKAFENGQLSKLQFSSFLRTLTDSDYTESIQQKIIQAIKTKDKNKERDSDCKSPDTNGMPIFSRPQPEQKEVKEIQKIVVKSVSEQILDELEKVLKIKKSDFDWDQSFQNYGLDSISGIQLATRLEKKFNFPIQPRWFIEHSTLNLFTHKLSQESQYNEVK